MGAFAAPAMMMAVQAGMSAASQIASSSKANDAADAQAQAMQAQADRQRQLLERQYASETRRRTNLLERATARARVSFGARGLSPTEGSAGALLDGIETDFGIDEAERANDFAMQRDSLAHGLATSLQRIDGARAGNLLSLGDDIQKRIFGLLRWGGGSGGKQGGGIPADALDFSGHY